MDNSIEKNNVASSPAGNFEKADQTIDASGLLCPEPLVLCKQALDSMGPGALVHVIATDPHAEIDFEVFTRRTSNVLVSARWAENTYHVLVRKA